MLIRNYMTPDPVTVRPDTPVEEIANLLLKHRINGVPVVNEAGGLLGIVTAADLVYRGANERLEPRESVWKENFYISFFNPRGHAPGKAEGRTAAEVMTAEIHTVGPDMHPSVAARLMVNHRLVSLPVMEEGKVIGIISRIDLLGHLKKMENPLKRED